MLRFRYFTASRGACLQKGAYLTGSQKLGSRFDTGGAQLLGASLIRNHSKVGARYPLVCPLFFLSFLCLRGPSSHNISRLPLVFFLIQPSKLQGCGNRAGTTWLVAPRGNGIARGPYYSTKQGNEPPKQGSGSPEGL